MSLLSVASIGGNGPSLDISLPEGLFEAAFAIYLIVKGFKPSPILDDNRVRPAAAT
jgi:hypothetical protein